MKEDVLARNRKKREESICSILLKVQAKFNFI